MPFYMNHLCRLTRMQIQTIVNGQQHYPNHNTSFLNITKGYLKPQ